MTTKLILVLLTTFLFACSPQNNTPKPQNPITEDEMVMLLVDFYKAEALLSEQTIVREATHSSIDSAQYNYLYKKYKLSRIDFIENFKYYNNKQKKLSRILGRVVDSLQADNDRLTGADKADSTNVE